MIEKIPDQIPVQTGEWRGTTFDIIPKETFSMACRKINELVDTVNTIQKEREAERFEIQEWISILEAVRESVNVHEKQIDELQMKIEPEKCETHADNSGKANCQENVLNDHYWYKQQERYKAALVLIRNLSGAGMSYHDMCIESREIAKWALEPDYKPLLIGRYSKDDQELFDTLRETKGGDNEL